MQENLHFGYRKKIKMYIDCPTCGQTEHESKFRKCGRCEQYICAWCRNNSHDCHDIYDDLDDGYGTPGGGPAPLD